MTIRWDNRVSDCQTLVKFISYMRLTVYGSPMLYTSSFNSDRIPWNEVRICSPKLDAKSEYAEPALLIQHDLSI